MYPPRRDLWWKVAVQMESEIARLAVVEDDFPIAFMFSTIYLRLEGKVPPPPPRIEIGLIMNAIENKSFHLRSASAFYNLPTPLPSPYFMPGKKSCEFQFQMDI